MECSKNGTNDHCLPDGLGAGPGPESEPNPRNNVQKLQSCLGVRVENLSSKRMARVKNLQKIRVLNLINDENHGDFGVGEVTVILWWTLTVNHNMKVENSLIA